MKTYTNINAQTPPFSAAEGMARLQGQPPRQYGDAAVQQHFGDIYRAAGQKAAVDLGRANTMAAGEHTNAANAAQNKAVLGGLSLLGQQQQNAQQRAQQMQDLAYGWMNTAMRNSPLGGLL